MEYGTLMACERKNEKHESEQKLEQRKRKGGKRNRGGGLNERKEKFVAVMWLC